MFVDIGCNGRVSDGGVFFNTVVAEGLREKSLSLSESSHLPGREKPVPYVILTDDAFPLQENILKPYPFRSDDIFSRIFNYRLSRARRMVESSFGILTTRFRVLLKPIHLNPEKTQLVKAAVVLHNYLLENSPRIYMLLLKQLIKKDKDGNVANGFGEKNSTLPIPYLLSPVKAATTIRCQQGIFERNLLTIF